MAANSTNNNGSNWVTARHGGNGKGSMVKKPAVVNHHGAVNAQHPDKPENAADAAEDAQDHGADEAQEGEHDEVHPYVAQIAANLRAQHGLTHNHSLRIAAGITKKHAAGNAQVDDATKSAAQEAHAHLESTLARAKAKGK